MLEVILLVMSQFTMIFLVGINQLNVMHGHVYLAGMTSVLIGICGFFNITTIMDHEFFSPIWLAYVLSGGIAIMCSMKVHPYITNFVGKINESDDMGC